MLKINGLGATMVIMHHSQIIFSTDVQDLYVKCVNSNTTKTQTAALAKPPFHYENTPSCVFEHFDQLDLKSQTPRLPPSTQTYTPFYAPLSCRSSSSYERSEYSQWKPARCIIIDMLSPGRQFITPPSYRTAYNNGMFAICGL